MALVLPDGLPAAEVLRREGFEIGTASCAERRLKPLRIGLVNLMPHKEATELAFARLLAQTGYPIELTLIVPATYQPRHTPHPHIERYYKRWPAVRRETFDA